MDAITDLAERLAQKLRRSVAVDDTDLRLLGSSTHFGDADPLRLVSLANRRIEGPVREATFAAGFPHWHAPRRGKALGVDGHEHDRMAFPLRSRYGPLGVMWVILPGEDELSEEETRLCLDTARDMERVLARRQRDEPDSDPEVEGLLLTLLSGEERDRAGAARDLSGLGYFEDATEATALVVAGAEPRPARGADERADVLRGALRQAVRSRRDRSTAFAVAEDHALLLIGGRGGTARSEYAKTAERVITEAARTDTGLAERLRLGVGPAVPLADAPRSYERARAAARAAVRAERPVALWEDHPREILLEAALRPEIDAALIPDLITETVQSQPEESLRTVACFLDRAGSVARTAQALHLHRTTVYYRLRLFEKETGLSLDDGGDRFLLQLWLAARDRAGYPPFRAGPP
ncbi:CdaR family transcriptional regulator [Nocardiopsis sp. CC223A]|uniref:PucR family transcriptional regulator n=1 Tax=Nocardiopsis sp. CC223A TaxID=3044051 RepID=UPI00278BB9A3|nr:PucR family transcriptional regulator [Nocardiopsis sp. CC223A]